MATKEQHEQLSEFIVLGNAARPGPWKLDLDWIKTENERIKWNADGSISKNQYTFAMHPRICRPMRQTNEDKANVPFILAARNLDEPLVAVILDARDIIHDLLEEIGWSADDFHSAESFLKNTEWVEKRDD